MVKRFRDLTQKYRTFRLAPDAIYTSHTIQTIFNKFTSCGKKVVARRQLMRTFRYLRCRSRYPSLELTLWRILWSLRIQLILVPTRRGKTFINVPTPVRRNQRDIIALQAFYNAVQSRKEKAFKDKLRCEIFALTTEKKQSSTLRLRSRYIANIYEERAWVEKRWK